MHRYLALSDRAVRLAAAWNHAGPLAGVDPVSGQEPATADAMRRQLAQIAALRALAHDERTLSDAARTVLPGGGAC